LQQIPLASPQLTADKAELQAACAAALQLMTDEALRLAEPLGAGGLLLISGITDGEVQHQVQFNGETGEPDLWTEHGALRACCLGWSSDIICCCFVKPGAAPRKVSAAAIHKDLEAPVIVKDELCAAGLPSRIARELQAAKLLTSAEFVADFVNDGWHEIWLRAGDEAATSLARCDCLTCSA
jgi:hypothetical protein